MKFMQASRWRTLGPWFAIATLLLVGVVLVVLVQPAQSSPVQEDVSSAAPRVRTENPMGEALSSGKQIETLTSNTEQQEEQSAPAVAALPSSDNCIACHTDKEQLKALAEEPEEVKSAEAEGEG